MTKEFNPQSIISSFNQEKYLRTGWNASLVQLESDNGNLRIIVRVATGRKFYPLFSEVINTTLGTEDPAIGFIKAAIHQKYTHPMKNRLISELQVMFSDLYGIFISLM